MTTSKKTISEIKLGILGGGQLGKMLIQVASRWNISTFILDPNPSCPAAITCNTFVQGSFNDYDQVYSFGKTVDLLTVEIENVNTDALIQLEKGGKIVFPEPRKLEIIKDKGLQKDFYLRNKIPSSNFLIFNCKEDILEAIKQGKLTFPFVQKLRKTGYDGRGVFVVKNHEDAKNMLDGQSLTEDLVNIKKEISVIVARNTLGEVKAFPPVEMSFNNSANIVEYLVCPAEIDHLTASKSVNIAIDVINAFDITGLLAVELFIDRNDKIYVNEVAPRPHNSGHQTIESAYTSQFEQHLRAILGLPLGSTKLISPSVMLNLLGEPGYSGPPDYVGIKECLKIEGVNIHLYGKNETHPFRKMGHVTIIDPDIESAKTKAQFVQKTLKIQSK